MTTGFPAPPSSGEILRLLDFLRELSANNNREWFHARREEYLRVMEIRDRMAEWLIAAVATHDSEAGHLTVKDVTYRLYRDVRFSNDKRPYKTNIGIFINPPLGKKSFTMGYYFNLQPGESFVCGGNICLPGPVITAVRRAIRDNIDEFLEIVESPEFQRLYPVYGDNPVKTAPKGFSKDWEHIRYVKPRDFCVVSAHDDTIFTAPDMEKRLDDYIRHAKRFNDFLNFTICDFIPELG